MHLIVGGDSEIGAATCRLLSAHGEPVVATTRRRDRASAPYLDLADPQGFAPPAGTRAACICAAVARIVDCARDPAASAAVNVRGTAALVEQLVGHGIYVLFLSTNQVFDGETAGVPADAPLSPVSEYGRQKAAAEAALGPHLGRHAGILRLTRVVSPDMALLRSWAQALRAREPVRTFHDMVMAPVPTALVAEATAALMRERAAGVFQLSGPADVTYASVARHMAQRLGAPEDLVAAVPAASAGMPAGATPRHTTLDSRALAQRWGIAAPGPWEVIDVMIDH